jgi:outer membrane protein TolC
VENQNQLLLSAQATAARTHANLSRLLAIDPTGRLTLAPIDLPEASDEAAIMTARRVLQPIPETAAGPLPESLQAALSEAFEQRPEIYRAEWARRAAEARVEFERKGALPTVTTTANNFYTPNVGGFARVLDTWSLVANVAAPIWDAGLSRARTKEAKADVTAATARLMEQRDLVAQEVKDSLTDLEEARERRRSTAANVTQAREALRIANVRYEAGLATSVEVTDALLALNQARTNKVNADNDFLAALADLNRSLGRYASAAIAALQE